MKKNLWSLSLTVLIILISAVSAVCQEAKAEAGSQPRIVLSPEDMKKLVTDVKDYLGLSVYFQGGYTYNFRNPDSGVNRQRVFDSDANSFLIDLAQIQFAKEAALGGVGYKVKVSAGETAKFIHSEGLGDPGDEFDLTEAYIDYVAPVGSGLKARFGKFATFLGAEVIEARDNFNYSRGFLFNFAIPFTHTGLMTEYTFSKILAAGLYFVNGWDVANDNNKGKTVGARIAVTPIEPLSMSFNFMYGPEQEDNDSHDRFIFDWVASFKATEKLTFMVNTDYAHEQKHPLNAGRSAEWYGVAAYAKYDFTDFFSAAIRGEYFNDEDGVRTGIRQKLKGITITPEIRLAKNLLLRPEYRHDWSNKRGFDSDDNVFDKKTQDTVSIGMMYTW